MITNKNDLHDITEILLKVAFNAITLTPYPLNLMTHIVIGYEVSCLLNIFILFFYIIVRHVYLLVSILFSVLGCNVVDYGFDPLSSQSKDYY